jgi:hypothetical protein
MPRLLLIGFVAFFGPASIVQAQFGGMGGGSTRPISLVVSGGMTLPTGDLGDFHDSGFTTMRRCC